MSLAVLNGFSLIGVHAFPVRVEAMLSSGLPAFHVVGLSDSDIRESRERVRGALISSGYAFPSGRLTVNLSPADLPKESSRFDLPIALGVLLASGQLRPAEDGGQIRLSDSGYHLLSQCIFLGELSLTGALLNCHGALPIAVHAHRHHPNMSLFMPHSGAQFASRIKGLKIFGARTLSEVVGHLAGVSRLELARPSALPHHKSNIPQMCLSEVRGQSTAKIAIEVAAAGGHSVLMQGSPGSGKTMLAKRLPGLIPPLSEEALLDAAMIQSMNGPLSSQIERPFRSPHHTASSASIIGGGKKLTLGEVTLAHKGILFLDELGEFNKQVLESLREPMESGVIHVSRMTYRAELPADFQLIAAMNPCPCGWFGHPEHKCRCVEDVVHRYLGKISGPLLDRMDMIVRMFVRTSEDHSSDPSETSMVVAQRVKTAWQTQIDRQGCLNAKVSDLMFSRHMEMTDAASRCLQSAKRTFGLSNRAVNRISRVARTFADLSADRLITETSVAQAVSVRQEIKKPV